MRVRTLLILILLVASPLAGCVTPETGLTAADASSGPTGVVLLNASVWTADPDQPEASAVAVRGDTIVAVGSDAEALAADVGSDPHVVDLHGAMVLPGFHDTHNHLLEVARATDPSEGNPFTPWETRWDPVTGTVSQQAVAASHVGTWSQRNADRIQEGGEPAPPHDDDHHVEGHDHEDVRDVLYPEGRTQANDLRMGPLEDANDRAAWRQMAELGFRTANRYGVTSHVEAGVDVDALDLLQEMEEDGDLPARSNLYVFPENLPIVEERGWSMGHGTDQARLLGLKIYSDGWMGPRTAALRDIYEDRPHRGFMFYAQEELDDYVLRGHQQGLKLTAHAIGDRAVEHMLTAYEQAAAEGCAEGVNLTVCEDPRFSLEHTQLVQPDLMERFVELGLVPSIQLSFAVSDSPWAEDALGEERLQYAYRWRTMVDQGLVVAGSSDFPIEVLPPLWGIERVVTRADVDGSPGPFMPEEAVALDTALRMVTINAAYLEHRDHELGSLTEGKLADIVVLEENLFTIPPEDIAETQVLLTMVDGEVVWDAGAATPQP